MKNILIFILFILTANALEKSDAACCHDISNGNLCYCSGVYECDIAAVAYDGVAYLPMCIEGDCQKNCYFADWLITIIATVGVFLIDLVLIFLFWLCCRNRGG